MRRRRSSSDRTVSIIVDGPAPAGGNAVTGRVTKVSYLGAHLQIVVQTESGLEITTHRPSTGASGDASGPAVGSTVRVTWSVTHSLGFAE